jgi:hypothetical protein
MGLGTAIRILLSRFSFDTARQALRGNDTAITFSKGSMNRWKSARSVRAVAPLEAAWRG